MIDNQTSSATKLYKIINYACSFDGSFNTSQVWSQVLLFDPNIDRTIENKYLELLRLFKYVEGDLNELAQTGVTTDKYLRAIDHVLLVLFSLPINSQWQQVKSNINSASLDVLASCGDLLISRGKGLRESSEEEIDKILLLIEDVKSQIINSDLEDSIKGILINKIDKLKESIKKCNVFGAIELKRATEEILTKTIILSKELEIDNLTEEGRNTFKSFIDVLVKCNSLYTLAEKIYPHLEHLMSYASQHLLTGK
ncbi:hypothetical protein [Chamaesiphon sp. VAR_69_metabat_338]|uniref:hypothetical protein n=1 Tax=Chamaesiphon sp. VAR_69_metabat_338 TaxID=2964704 RepID=UPI00286E2CDF|nr:hypothetical protein [Chamaesiphon sp. VAR_69_metabat_338]